MSRRASRTEVLVAGAGPAGLSVAIELARRDVGVRIVDAAAARPELNRAVMLHARTIEVLAGMGIAEQVLLAGARIHGATVYAGSRRVIHFDFDELDSLYRFAIDLPQSHLEQILEVKLRELGVTVERGCSVSVVDAGESEVRAAIDHEGSVEQFEVPYLVGCDGANSRVRQSAAISFCPAGPPESLLMADVEIEWELPADEWHFWFHESGLLSVMPLPGGAFRVVADAPDPGTTPGDMLRLWSTRNPLQAKLSHPVNPASYTVTPGNASSYRRGRIFLGGDAAHIFSPTGGQGLNVAIQDGHNLGWKIALALSGKCSASLLDSYELERARADRNTLHLTEQIGALATLRGPISQAIRDRILPLLAEMEIIEQRLVSRLSETSLHYRNSPLTESRGRWYSTSPCPGDRAPTFGPMLRGTGFHVLLFTGEQPTEEALERLAAVERYLEEGYRGLVDSWLVARSDIEWSGATIRDPDGLLHQRYGAGLSCIYVIRPDQYIGFRSLGPEPLPLLEYLSAVFDNDAEAPATA